MTSTGACCTSRSPVGAWLMAAIHPPEAPHAINAAERQGQPYQVVITDYQMPGMDGATLAAAVKANPRTRNTVFVMLTSLGHWSEVRGFEGVSVDACLVKPVRQSQLM